MTCLWRTFSRLRWRLLLHRESHFLRLALLVGTLLRRPRVAVHGALLLLLAVARWWFDLEFEILVDAGAVSVKAVGCESRTVRQRDLRIIPENKCTIDFLM